MGKPNQNEVMMKASESASKLVVVAVICLAVGVGAGYYFGKSSGSAPMAVATPGAPTQTQLPSMDPAVFLATEATLKKKLESNPKDAGALAELGNLYYDNNKYQLAIDAYGKALELNPNDISVRTDRGSCYWSLGQADPAIADFQKSLEVDPNHPQTLYNLGIVYLHGKNDMAGARKAWEKLLAANPNYPQRDRIQQMLASMSSTGPTESTPATGTANPAQGKPGASNMEDLFKKMKK